MNAELQAHAGRYMLHFERRLMHSPAKVWRALTERAELDHWFPARTAELDLRVGGTISFVFPDQSASASGGVITELDPPRLLAFTWEGELLRWELRPDGAGCVLVFTHTFDDRPGAASFASGWEICLDALEAVLLGRPVPRRDDQPVLHEAYVARFGLAAGRVERTAGGWRVRFDRQLMGPLVERVWELLLGAQPVAPVLGAAPPAGFVDQAFVPGAITAVDAPELLEYSWLDDGNTVGSIRWELSAGPGGARITLLQSGTPNVQQRASIALAAWEAQLQRIAEQVSAVSSTPSPIL